MSSLHAMAKSPEVPIEQLQATLRERIKARAGGGIRGLGRTFRNIDDDGNKKLNKMEFAKALTELGISVNRTDGDGNISFDEFLEAIRGDMNARRRTIVEKAFAVMDSDKNGYLDLNDLAGRFKASGHPKVVGGEMTEQEVLEEFLNGFEGQMGNRDGKVTPEEWINYYTSVSASIDNDDHFALLMKNAWGVDE